MSLTPNGATPSAPPPAEPLPAQQCLRLLRTTRRGRVATTVAALPVILLVDIAMAEDEIVVSAQPTGLGEIRPGTVIALQADGVQSADRSWSVHVTGVAQQAGPGAKVTLVPSIVSGWLIPHAGAVAVPRSALEAPGRPAPAQRPADDRGQYRRLSAPEHGMGSR